MKKNKYIKEIAKNLPVVMDQTVSGYYIGKNDDGEPSMLPNIINHPINHERRLRKTYEQLGMDGIKQYLLTIYNLQYDLQNRQNLQNQKERVDSDAVLPELRSTDPGSDD